MRKAIRENIHFGARVIKIVVDDQRWHLFSGRYSIHGGRKRQLPGLLAAHCVTEAGARNAAEGGVASIGTAEMSDEVLAIKQKNNVVLVGTDFTEKAWLAYEMPAELCSVSTTAALGD